VVDIHPAKEITLIDIMNNWMEAARFSWDVQRVVALRMMRLASGGPRAVTEAEKMLSEKAMAFGEAQIKMAMALATGRSFSTAAAKAYAPIRRRVRANRRRLSA
jgi:hypothetical protein